MKKGIQNYRVEKQERIAWDATAASEWFHAIGSVCPQTILWEFGIYASTL